jgi:cyclopropane fatty-acyl-phospholipid synthase-like methyltransferase
MNCREYVAMHHRLGIDEGDRLLDVACGAGLALELAALRGATGAGIVVGYLAAKPGW